MPLSHEIEQVFMKLKGGFVDPEVASKAIEQLISAYVRKSPAQLDVSIRSAISRMRLQAADLIAVEAEIMAWTCLRTEPEDQAVMWL